MKDALIITLDGPAASGKSSVARALADALHIPFVSSGLLYRAATLLVLEHGVNAENADAVLALLEQHEVVLQALPIEPNRVWIDGEDISAALHTDDIDALVSAVARHGEVRDWVREQLRKVAGSFVVEGRDMGTDVFPNAAIKAYLTAPAAVRAQRRVGERTAGLGEVTAAILRRDALDARQSAPATDALQIDTGQLTLDQVVARLLEHVEASHPG